MSKGIIGTVLSGGLGNVMFQIANIEYLGHKYDMDVVYTNPRQWIDNSINVPALGWSPNAGKISEIFPNVDIFKNQDRVMELETQVQCPFRYREIIPKDKFIYNGYFQSEMFFPDKEFILNLFEPSREIRQKIIGWSDIYLRYKTCAIHVRRGDYIRQPQYHPLQDMTYYDRAMELVTQFEEIGKYMVFSNDIPWCRDNFTGDDFIFSQNQDYIELFLMARCDHHIIANSSFSWWSSYLGETIDTITVAPKNDKWFGEALPDSYAIDIVPLRWFQV
jgi:hypothetical protein